MKDDEFGDLDEPDPDSSVEMEAEEVDLGSDEKAELKVFSEDVKMIGKFKRMMLRRKLKNEKIRLLIELKRINKRLEILDSMDAEVKEQKGLIR